MSLVHVETLLNTLKQFNDCEISVTFNNESNVPILSVCYENNKFEITFLNEQTVQIYDDLETTLTVIDGIMHETSV